MSERSCDRIEELEDENYKLRLRTVLLSTAMLQLLSEAVTEHCTCGGGGPTEGCPACKVWHSLAGELKGKEH